MTSTMQMITLMSIMMVMNIALMFVQGAILEVNPSGQIFFNESSSPYANYAGSDSLLVDDSLIPADDSIEADSSGNVFSDTYRTMKAWTRTALAPLNFIADILKQPYGFLKDIGLPVSVALAVGAIWYITALLIFVSWLMGR